VTTCVRLADLAIQRVPEFMPSIWATQPFPRLADAPGVFPSGSISFCRVGLESYKAIGINPSANLNFGHATFRSTARASNWAYIHWTLAIGFTVLAVEALYFLAPNVKQRFSRPCRGLFLPWVAGCLSRMCLVCISVNPRGSCAQSHGPFVQIMQRLGSCRVPLIRKGQ
jgi:hypothetical protein